MPSEKQPRKNIEQEMQREQVLLAEKIASKRWEDLNAQNFPLPIEVQAKPFYLTRLGLINEEMHEIVDTVGNKEALYVIRGRIQELRDASSATIMALYPNVKPITEDTSPVTPEEIEAIEDFVERGALDQLNDANLTGWNQLTADQRLLYRLKALQVYNSGWKDVGSDDSLDPDKIGFDLPGHDKEGPSIKKFSGIVRTKIISRHLSEWLKEAEEQGLKEDDALVKAARKLIESATK